MVRAILFVSSLVIAAFASYQLASVLAFGAYPTWLPLVTLVLSVIGGLCLLIPLPWLAGAMASTFGLLALGSIFV